MFSVGCYVGGQIWSNLRISFLFEMCVALVKYYQFLLKSFIRKRTKTAAPKKLKVEAKPQCEVGVVKD